MTEEPQHPSPKKKASVGSELISALLILAILVVLNVLLTNVSGIRADLTEDKLYTLSDGTKTILSELDKDVTLKLYFSKSHPDIPADFKQYGTRIHDLLKEYEGLARGKITLEVEHLEPNSDAEDWARKYGLNGQVVNPFGGDPFYLGLVAIAGKKEDTIPVFSTSMEGELEYQITRLIYDVSTTKKPKIGIISSLPAMGGPPMPFQMQQQQQPQRQKWLFVRNLESLYDVEEVLPTVETIPEDVDTLMVIHPKSLQDKTIFAIDQFLLGGGRLMLFTDPFCIAEQENSPQPNRFGMGTNSDLNKLTQAWGVSTSTTIVGDPQASTDIQGQGNTVDSSISWLSLRGKQFNKEDQALSGLEIVMAIMAGHITGTPAEGLTMTSLITTSEESGTLEVFQAMQPGHAAAKALTPKASLPIAARLHGTFKTAFPDGPPSAEGEDEENAPADFLKESRDSGVVIMVADVDMLYDRFVARQVRDFFGARMVRLNENLALLMNLAEQATGSEAMIGLRNRGKFERPFTVVNKMLKQAQTDFQKEQEEVQQELADIEKRFNELQSLKSKEQKFVLTPEQQEEQRKYAEQKIQISKRQRELEKNLRKDIKTLGLQLKIANIAGIPICVGLFGIARWLYRRKRAVSK